MKTTEEFSKYFEDDLKSDLAELEKERLKIQRNLIPLAITGCAIILLFFLFLVHFSLSLPWMIAPLIVCGILFGGWYISQYRNFADRFKEIVIKKILVFVDPGLLYEKDSFAPKELFMESGLFPDTIDRYDGDDYVSGKVGDTDILFSEIHAKRVETSTGGSGTDSRRRTETHVYPIFSGLFFIGDFNKDFKTKTFVLPDTAEKMFGRFGQKLQSINRSRGELIRLEDPEFERLFVVYGEDQVESRYILSTGLMQRIVDFHKRRNRKVYISFVASRIFIAVSYDKDLFEPRIFSSLTEYSNILEYFEDLQLAVGIVEELNLNTRIWGKGKGSHA